MTQIVVVVPEVLPVFTLHEIDPRIFANRSIVPAPSVLPDVMLTAPALANLSAVPGGAVFPFLFTEIDAPALANSSSLVAPAVVESSDEIIRLSALSSATSITAPTVSEAPSDVTLRPAALPSATAVRAPLVTIYDPTLLDGLDPVIAGEPVASTVI